MITVCLAMTMVLWLMARRERCFNWVIYSIWHDRMLILGKKTEK